jgi:hypothetical protein
MTINPATAANGRYDRAGGRDQHAAVHDEVRDRGV